ncbi:MAG: kinaselike protein, partial [Acidobacteriaceae bacterium]|nr:kinaselike protein [Acidobacteriaceae bacterium]
DMRKWMSDRLKRRKKTAEEGKGEAKPAPLQPAYFDKDTTTAKSSGPDSKEVNFPDEVKMERKADRAEQRHAEAHHTEPPTPKAEGAHTERPDSHADSAHFERDAPSEAEAGEETPSEQTDNGLSQGSDSSDLQRRRRRRGRGGRGRGRNAAAHPVVPSAPGAELPRPEQADRVQHLPALPSATTPAVSNGEAGAPRASKGIVVLAIGLPGSGKSSWFKRHQISPLSSDLLRALLFDDPTEQRFQDLVFSNLRSMLKARLIARRPMNYVDATNLTPHERNGWIKLAKDYGYEVQAVFFDVPLETCLERNHKRQRVVSDDVMKRMSGKMKAPTFEEGFSKITVVRVKPKE